MAKKWTSISTWIEIHDLLDRQAKRNGRTISGHVRILAERDEAEWNAQHGTEAAKPEQEATK